MLSILGNLDTACIGMKKRASVALKQGDAVIFSTNGVDIALTASATVAGIINQPINSTSTKLDGVTSNYATTDIVPVITFTPAMEIEADTVNGSTIVPAIGVAYDLGAYDSVKGSVIDATVTSVGQFLCVRRSAVDGSKAIFVVNPAKATI